MILGTDLSTNETVHISTDALRRHLYIVGKSGTGKSALLDNLTMARIDAGAGVCLIDPHGDLAEKIAATIPKSRMNDVIYFDPSDPAYSIAYNPLSCREKDQRPLMAENVLSAFAHVWGLSAQHTPRLLHILRNALRLLLDSDQTLLGLPRLLITDRYRARLLRRCTDPTVRSFWEEEFKGYNDRLRSDAISAIQNKAGAFVSNPAVRNVIGQQYSSFTPSHLMDRGEILICNLSKGKLGEETSSLLGALIATGFAQAAHGRAAIPEEARRDFTMFIDEFQNFSTSSFVDILSESRKNRLSLVVAHQFLSQLPDILQDAVIGTANTTVAFRCGAKDAALLASELDLDQPRRVTNLPNFHALVRTIEADVPGNTRVVRTAPPRSVGDRLSAVRTRTRTRYARPRAAVEAEIQNFLDS